jgi:hypothetical protein
MWFVPFVFLALLLATNEKTALDGEDSARQTTVVGYPQEQTDREQPTGRKESSYLGEQHMDGEADFGR